MSFSEIYPPELFLDGFILTCSEYQRESWSQQDSQRLISVKACPKILALLKIVNLKCSLNLMWRWVDGSGDPIKESPVLVVNEESRELGSVVVQDLLDCQTISYRGEISVLVFLNGRFFCRESFVLSD